MLSDNILSELANRYGTPLFVIDEPLLEQQVTAFCAAFRQQWPLSQVCYSVKTNYLPWIVQKMHRLGVWPEVISGFELDLVKALALAGPVIVNGPVKTREELLLCLQQGYRIHVDNLDELSLLSALCQQLQTCATIGLRLRPRQEQWKRFGFEFASIAWQKAMQMIDQSRYLHLTGMHMHIGTGIIDVQKYAAAAEFMREVVTSLPNPLTYIDMGGGFATPTARLSHYDSAQWQVPSPADYARAIITPLKPYLEQHQCTLLVEPGRALIDEAVTLLTQVMSVDTQRIIVDAGKNIVPSVESRVHPLRALNRSALPVNQFDVFGPLCMGSDCLGRGVELAKPSVGDYLKLLAVGAYSQSQSMQFIKYQPAVVVASVAQHQLVRRRQTLADLLVTDL